MSLLVMVVCFVSILAHGNEPGRDPLFHIERNKNANIVQYDAQLAPDGRLLSREPVVGYWIRLANEGEIKELSWVQQKFAYGFKAKLNEKENTVILDMAAKLGRTILVRRDDEDYRAIAEIDGVESFIEKIYISASGSGMSTRVDYIELFGEAVETRDDQHERFSP